MDRNNLGNFIYKLRDEAGMERKELAALLGVSTAAICQYENSGSIKTEKLFQLAEIFGVTLAEILDGKRVEMSLEEKWDEKNKKKKYDLHQLIEESDPQKMTEYFRKITAIRERFYSLLVKTLFKKRSTADEEKELTFLWQYFDENTDGDEYMKNAVLANMKNDESAIRWELEKEYFLNRKYLYDEETAVDIIDYINWNIAELWDDDYFECYAAMIESMSKIERDLCFSDMFFDEDAPMEFYKAFIKQGAEILFPPRIKSKSAQDDEIFDELIGQPELDRRLTQAMKIYSSKFINDFSYAEYLRLNHDEYLKCIDTNTTRSVKTIASSSDSNSSSIWNTYKKLRAYPILNSYSK